MEIVNDKLKIVGIVMLKKYRIGFDIFGLLLFLLIMIPNFIWFAVSAPNDVLRVESFTPIIDGIGSVSQVVFIATIYILKRKGVDKIRFSKLLILSLAMVIAYFMGWILYYSGIVNPIVIILLTIPPCMAFILYAVDRKNVIATILTVIFTVCHVTYEAVNYIV